MARRSSTRRLLTLLLAATVALVAVSSQTSPPFPSDKPQPPKIPSTLPSGGSANAIAASSLPTTLAPLEAPPLSLANAPVPTPESTPAPTSESTPAPTPVKTPAVSRKAPVSKTPKPATPAPSKTSKALESLETSSSTASSSTGSSSSSSADVTTPPPATKKPKSPKSKAPPKNASAAGSGDDNPELSAACVCSRLRRVSLMGAADYCLPAAAATGDKCGNVALAERGECPRAGAQPCQDTGHVLSNDSICAYDKRQDVYKCVASKDDLDIQHNGGKRPRARRSTNGSSAGASSSVPDASQESDGGRRARWSLVVATLVSAAVATALVV